MTNEMLLAGKKNQQLFAAVSPIVAKPRHGELPAYRYTWPRHSSTRTQIAHCPAVHRYTLPLAADPVSL